MSRPTTLPDDRAGAVMPPLGREAERRRRLTVMRRWATGTLVAVSVGWLAIVLTAPSGDWAGYVRAALEASMVGALADWFAVVALFRRPLGLPIPHTAVVVERKEQFGQTLATFFRENFLSGAAVGERLHSSGAVVRASSWLAEPANATRLVRDVLRRAAPAIDASGDRITALVVEEIRQLLVRVPATTLTAGVLRTAATSPELDEVVGRACAAAGRSVVEHAEELEAMFVGDRPWWLPEVLQHRLFDHLVDQTVGTLDAIARDPEHPARARLRRALVDLADRLERSPALAARVAAFQRSLAQDPRVDEALTRLVGDLVDRFRIELLTPGSRAEERLAALVVDLGCRVRDDAALHARIERALEAAVDEAMALFGGDVDALVTGTIARWDAARTADQLELLLGPDLQYIRINGAVVGGVAGLLLYAVAQAIG